MGSIWTVARHTVSESMRMKIAVFFIVLLAVLVLGLPFLSKGDNSVSGAVQSFLVYSVMSVTFLLSCLSIFLFKSISDDLTGMQIQLLMTKPLARWQYILGKWCGVMLLNTGLLIVSGGVIYAMTRYVAAQPPRDAWDKEQLENQVLVARHVTPFKPPDHAPDAAAIYERNLEEGKYASILEHDPDKEKQRLSGELDRRWRSVQPGEAREFVFEDVRCDRREGQNIHVQYETRVFNFPPDEVLRCAWIAGDREKGTPQFVQPRRDVLDRKHTVSFPAQAVADDRTLKVLFVNANPFVEMGEEQWPNTVVFEGDRAVEVLFSVSSFESNLVRTLVLVWCRLAFLSAVAALATAMFSFPVACLVTLVVFTLCSVHGFVTDALEYMTDEGKAADVFKVVAQWVLRIPYLVVPDFSRVDGLSMLVEGRNVTLMWVLTGLGNLVLIKTTILLLAACLIFQRREVSETSL